MLKLMQGNCNKLMKTIKSNTIDSIITDPPYGINFMGKKWDYDIPSIRCFKRMLRIAKPGAILLCFGGTRTFHRMACNIEDAGWQIRDCIMYMYGSGFPKSHNISKAIAKTKNNKQSDIWDGWGTGLKPAFEPIIIAMKPLDGTFAHNALKWGVAGLNIDASRIEAKDMIELEKERMHFENYQLHKKTNTGQNFLASKKLIATHNVGRWPANIILDKKAGKMLNTQAESTSRFFYCAKVSKKERNLGLKKSTNKHPTVKSLSLMKYLCTLTQTPLGGIVLDPFMGSGTTGMAAKLTGRHFIGIEKEEEYIKIAKLRMKATERKKPKHGIPSKEKIFKIS